MRNRMGSGNRMGSVQQVTINSYRHMFLLVYISISTYIPVIIPVRRWSQWGGLGWGGDDDVPCT